MSRALEINSMNDVLSVSMSHNSKINSYHKLNTRPKKDIRADISLASWLLRCAKKFFKSNDLLMQTDRVVCRIACSEAAKYF